MRDASEINSNVAAIRQRRGISASMLAQSTGVSRQTIYALEAGSYVPNTIVGLRLARALGVAVEDLFVLNEKPQGLPPRSEAVTFIPSSQKVRRGQPVQLCEVDGKLIATPARSATPYLPESDAVLSSPGRVILHERKSNFGGRLLIAGCDPAMAILARHLQPAGVEIMLIHQNSSDSLSLLKGGYVHIAGTHLQDATSGESNVGAVNRRFPGKTAAVISFAALDEGLVTARGNPKKIRGVEDLTRKGVVFVNREVGSGSRQLLDAQLRQQQVDAECVAGYARTACGHLAVASEVNAGTADCCVATRAAAQAFGLHFIPLKNVRYDLVIRKQHLDLPPIRTLLGVLNKASFRQKLSSMGAYDVEVTGSRVI